MVNTKEGHVDKLEKWVDRNLMKLNKKCKVLQLRRNSLRHQYRSSARLSVRDTDKKERAPQRA